MATPWLHVPTFRIAIPPSDLYYIYIRMMKTYARTYTILPAVCSMNLCVLVKVSYVVAIHVRVRRVSMLKGRMCKKGTWKFHSPRFPCTKTIWKILILFFPFFFFLSNLFLSRNNSSRQDEEAPAGRFKTSSTHTTFSYNTILNVLL